MLKIWSGPRNENKKYHEDSKSSLARQLCCIYVCYYDKMAHIVYFTVLFVWLATVF